MKKAVRFIEFEGSKVFLFATPKGAQNINGILNATKDGPKATEETRRVADKDLKVLAIDVGNEIINLRVSQVVPINKLELFIFTQSGKRVTLNFSLLEQEEPKKEESKNPEGTKEEEKESPKEPVK